MLEVEARAAQAPPGPVCRRIGAAATLLAGVGAAARPRHWSKNLLVFAAPAAAGVLGDAGVLARTTAAFAVFSLAASGGYLVNDARDAEADRRHPAKRLRPVAAGTVSPALATWAGSALLLFAVALASVVAGWRLVLVVGAYAAVQPIYSAHLKRVPFVDLGVVASGFVLRAVAGGVAAPVRVSAWFVLVVTFASLYVVAGKRQAEHESLGEARAAVRATLGHYSVGSLRRLRSLVSAAAVSTYCLWAFDTMLRTNGSSWYGLSVIPFVLGLARYELVVESGRGAAPEDVLVEDRPLQLLGLIWLLAFGFGVHGG